MINFSDIEQDFIEHYMVPCSDLTTNGGNYNTKEIKTKILDVPENDFLDKITQYIKAIEVGRQNRLLNIWEMVHIEHQRLNYSGFHYIAQHPESNEKWLDIGERYGFNSIEYFISDESSLKNAIHDLKNLIKTKERKGLIDLYWLITTNSDAKIELYKFLDEMFHRLKEHLREIQKFYEEKDPINDHTNLMSRLIEFRYIFNVASEQFNNVINNGPFPAKDYEKIIWKEKPAEAIRFCDYLGLKYDDWNKYFVLESEKRLNATSKSKGIGKINEILKELGYKDATGVAPNKIETFR